MMRPLRPRDSAQPTAALRPAPYSVERFPAVNGAIYLVGYDGEGEPMVELRIRERCFTDRTVERMRTWMMSNDITQPPEPPTRLALVE